MNEARLDHIGIAVTDLERALEFYCGALGATRVELQELTDVGLRIARVSLGNVQFELIQSEDWQRTAQRHLGRSGPGAYHVALRVHEADPALAQLDDAGVELIDRVARKRDGLHAGFCAPAAAGGVLVEIVSRHAAEK